MRPGQPNISPQRQARIAKAVALKLKGKSYRAIADELGIDVHQAFDDVWQHFGELDKLATEELEQVRKVELARMDTMLVRLFEIIEREPVARVDEDASRPSVEFVDTDGGAVKAITAASRLMERRAKLLGLDAPTKIQEVPIDGAGVKDLVKAILDDDAVKTEVVEQLKGKKKK